MVVLFDRLELVSHQDFCPGNVVFRDGLPAALADVDIGQRVCAFADAHGNERIPARESWLTAQAPAIDAALPG